jgi:pSer/pThr/pTyr-binding forkhead associated (FHA) protein
MNVEIRVAADVREQSLSPGRTSVGGGEADGIRIPGLPPGRLQLLLDGGQLMVEAEDGFLVDGVASPARVARLVLPGEVISVPGGLELRVPPAQVPGPQPALATAAVLRSILGGAPEPAPLAPSASLVCLTGLDAGRRFPLAYEENRLGRGERLQVRVRDRTVSRHHATIRRNPGGWEIEDLGSPNGVFLDGARLRGHGRLEDGTLVQLGQALLRFRGEPNAAEEGGSPGLTAEQPGVATPERIGAAVPDPAGTAEPDLAAPGAIEPASRSRVGALELALIGAGVLLSVAGLVVLFGLAAG